MNNNIIIKNINKNIVSKYFSASIFFLDFIFDKTAAEKSTFLDAVFYYSGGVLYEKFLH